MSPRRLIMMAAIALPLILIYFSLRASVLGHFGSIEDLVAAVVIGSGSALLVDYFWPRDKDEP